MKRCRRCEQDLPVDAFALSRKATDGRQSWCRACKKEHAAARLRAMSPEERAALNERRKARRPKYAEHEAAYQKRWIEANRPLVRAAAARQRAKPGWKERHAVYWPKWREENREKVREYARRGQHVRRARLADAPYEHIDHAEVFARDEGVCGICGNAVDPANWHLDHIQPIALGGGHVYANVRVTHPFCNIARSRGTRDEKARAEEAVALAKRGLRQLSLLGDDGWSRIAE